MTAAARAALFLFKGYPSYKERVLFHYTKIPSFNQIRFPFLTRFVLKINPNFSKISYLGLYYREKGPKKGREKIF